MEIAFASVPFDESRLCYLALFLILAKQPFQSYCIIQCISRIIHVVRSLYFSYPSPSSSSRSMDESHLEYHGRNRRVKKSMSPFQFSKWWQGLSIYSRHHNDSHSNSDTMRNLRVIAITCLQSPPWQCCLNENKSFSVFFFTHFVLFLIWKCKDLQKWK